MKKDKNKDLILFVNYAPITAIQAIKEYSKKQQEN